MTRQSSANKCLENSCEGCPIARLSGSDVSFGAIATAAVLIDPGYAHLPSATAGEIVGMAEQVTESYGIRHLNGPVAGALALKATGRCEG